MDPQFQVCSGCACKFDPETMPHPLYCVFCHPQHDAMVRRVASQLEKLRATKKDRAAFVDRMMAETREMALGARA